MCDKREWASTTETVYADAETRGQLRLWKHTLAQKQRRLDRIFETGAITDSVINFCENRSAIGRRRAFDRIKERIAKTGATLEGVRLDGRAPCAVWSILKPRDPVTVEPDDPSYAQHCISVNYIFIGALGNQAMQCDGLWTLEIPDHALGRMMQRSRVDPAACVAAAHHGVLRVRGSDVIDSAGEAETQFLVRSGPGAFICSLRSGPDLATGDYAVHVRTATWLHEDMMYAEQVPLIDDGLPGDRLGDSWLLPDPLRLVVKGEGGMLHAFARKPGMPELMAAPQGRA